MVLLCTIDWEIAAKMVEERSLKILPSIKINENIGKNDQNQHFQNSVNLPKVYKNLGSVYSRKRAESQNSESCDIFTGLIFISFPAVW